jgi:hypothetical protein
VLEKSEKSNTPPQIHVREEGDEQHAPHKYVFEESEMSNTHPQIRVLEE